MNGYRTLDDLTRAAREFAVQIMRPEGLALDRMDPARTVAETSPIFTVHREFRRRGFHRVMLPVSLGGSRESLPGNAFSRMSEELGYGDSGLAISLAASGMPFSLMMLSASAEVRSWAEAYAHDLDAKMIGCWGITEPAHGSDWVVGTTPQGNDPKLAAGLRAELSGDHYVLNGQKSAWVSNGTIATHSVLHVGLDASRGMHGTGIAFCPLDLPGISKGKPLDKVGQRALNQGEIFFENVKLPRSYMLIGNPAVLAIDGVGRTFLGAANLETGTVMAGLARAAFDEALAHAKQSGRFASEQSVRIELFDMFAKVEAASALARRAARTGDGRGVLARIVTSKPGLAISGQAIKWFLESYERLQDKPWVKRITRAPRPREGLRAGLYGIACKTFCTQVSYEVASAAVQIVGHDALLAGHPLQKMLRDARAALIEDGTNEMLALAGAEDL
jgi:alkylation response protein AidB-like acyl-CoA dehydrogenase